jgi:hypothetical protein
MNEWKNRGKKKKHFIVEEDKVYVEVNWFSLFTELKIYRLTECKAKG